MRATRLSCKSSTNQFFDRTQETFLPMSYTDVLPFIDKLTPVFISLDRARTSITMKPPAIHRRPPPATTQQRLQPPSIHGLLTIGYCDDAYCNAVATRKLHLSPLDSEDFGTSEIANARLYHVSVSIEDKPASQSIDHAVCSQETNGTFDRRLAKMTGSQQTQCT
ncbi:uncharacterized protein M421DRAFT_201700 [Didymella exigua CBS 183.55]|uniref:Uncharacterized protein n=1 Tax=Didymella exigua CBS 183.55 TaxID=1150837 RepID=A0A6A5RZ02_9PLEO|nr:uncharacterized protein M421DRAFT_201700 [Didymella exigua CBS 183.55]KAF1933631.1 hypothetical protein M421DRAFT_201700 [Didymella exigua CBS 183.55]